MDCNCIECRANSELRGPQGLAARQKAEDLLARYLIPAQLKDWKKNRAFNVRGSNRRIYRVYSQHVVRSDGYLTNVWVSNLRIPADAVLGIMFYLQSNAREVEDSGCHDEARGYEIHSYMGRI